MDAHLTESEGQIERLRLIFELPGKPRAKVLRSNAKYSR
jgi:ferritin-like metal-binding protein YciE